MTADDTPASTSQTKATSDETEPSSSSRIRAIRVTFHDNSVQIFALNRGEDVSDWRWTTWPDPMMHGVPAEKLVIRPKGKGVPRVEIPMISMKYYEVIFLDELEESPHPGRIWPEPSPPKQVWRGTMENLKTIMGLPEGYGFYMTVRPYAVVTINDTGLVQPPPRKERKS